MIAPVLACMTVDKYLVKLTSQIPEKPLLHSLANGSPVVQTGKPCKETQSDSGGTVLVSYTTCRDIALSTTNSLTLYHRLLIYTLSHCFLVSKLMLGIDVRKSYHIIKHMFWICL